MPTDNNVTSFSRVSNTTSLKTLKKISKFHLLQPKENITLSYVHLGYLPSHEHLKQSQPTPKLIEMKTSVNSMMRICHFIYNNDEAIENKIAKSETLFFLHTPKQTPNCSQGHNGVQGTTGSQQSQQFAE